MSTISLISIISLLGNFKHNVPNIQQNHHRTFIQIIYILCIHFIRMCMQARDVLRRAALIHVIKYKNMLKKV